MNVSGRGDEDEITDAFCYTEPVMATETLDFEAPLTALQKEIESLTGYPEDTGKEREIARLQTKLDAMRREIYAKLTPWQRVHVARHSQRPYALDFVEHLFTDYVEIKGDRRFGEDPAVVSGMAWFHDEPVVVIGHQKGRDTKQKIRRNFGMARPEGYRKALRVMKMAEKFSRPIFCFVDTPGAYPGIDAEERGQAEAIAVNIREMARIRVPIIVTITGEGGERRCPRDRRRRRDPHDGARHILGNLTGRLCGDLVEGRGSCQGSGRRAATDRTGSSRVRLGGSHRA